MSFSSCHPWFFFIVYKNSKLLLFSVKAMDIRKGSSIKLAKPVCALTVVVFEFTDLITI